MRLLGLLLVLLVAFPAAAASASAPVPLLWKVDKGERSVYLLGSFHLLKPSDYPLSAEVDAAFDDAESLLFEMPPEELGSIALAMEMGRAALRTDGTTLDSELPPATAQRLGAWLEANQARLQARGLNASMLQLFEPWFVGLNIALLGMGDAGLDPELGLDRHFATEAADAGKPTAGLETGSEQIAFLDGMDPVEQVQLLEEALANAQPGSSDIEDLHALWRAGDVAALWDRMARDMQHKYPRLYERINVERNEAWLPRIEARLQGGGDEDTLVVVGALHLLGDDGLVARLRDRGYAVERICSACAVP
jgi:uncharacterized protein YbaP (TraB family)